MRFSSIKIQQLLIIMIKSSVVAEQNLWCCVHTHISFLHRCSRVDALPPLLIFFFLLVLKQTHDDLPIGFTWILLLVGLNVELGLCLRNVEAIHSVRDVSAQHRAAGRQEETVHWSGAIFSRG